MNGLSATDQTKLPAGVLPRTTAFAAKRTGNNGIKLEGLLVSQDMQIVSALSRALDSFDVEPTVAKSMDKAEESIMNAKFDAIIIDLRNRDLGGEVLRAVRSTKLNRRTLIVAIADDYQLHQLAFKGGANFTIPRVSTLDQATRCLRSSYFMMLRQRRSSMRFPVDMPITIRQGERMMEVRVMNLSETGMGLETSSPLGMGDLFASAFDLPGTGKPVKINARTVWTSERGVAGAVFCHLEETAVQNLQDWINANVMGRFQFTGADTGK